MLSKLLSAAAVAALFSGTLIAANDAVHANDDPAYRQLRSIGVGGTFAINNADLPLDVATFHLAQGTLTFLQPVNGHITGAIFVGRGHFTLKPVLPIDQKEVLRRTGENQVEEDFSSVVFRYSPNLHRVLVAQIKDKAEEATVANVFSQWQEKVRKRREIPKGLTEELLNGSEMDNIDAEILSSIYTPVAEHSFFQAYIRGDKHKDLRLYFKTRGGAIPALGSPEEVGLLNFDPEGADDGVWYLEHTQAEFKSGMANSQQDRRFVKAHKFTINTNLGNNDHLTSVATITFEPLIAGERVIRFNLLPNLRVTRVSDAENKEMSFIQEGRKEDGSFYAILPAPAELKKEYTVRVEYSGDKVVTKAGSGSFYIDARDAWYPNINSFSDRALYDLTFRIPKKFHLISIGKLDSETTEEGQNVTHWVTPTPVYVAGFNYGDYKKIEDHEDKTGYDVAGYYLPTVPDVLAHIPAAENMAPGGMTKNALEQTKAQLQICTNFFGKSAYNTIGITEQPDFAFGQSWPNLVYLPISAYLDGTQRVQLFNGINNSFTAFVDEVTPHEVAHQWFGHTVGWASYHDQWLSEGFAEFAAALYVQNTSGPKWQKEYTDFWERLHKQILEKNQYGVTPNDAGPIWLGLRLMTPHNAGAYRLITYPKGAYILSMVRSLFYTNKDHDAAFMEMMHDYIDTHREIPASTESFKAVVEKHMPKSIDLENNGRLDWFFREWVYGTEVPKYDLDYQTTPAADGKTHLHLSVTQSEVSANFAMFVPVFVDFGKGLVRLGQVPVIGNSTKTLDVDLPAEPKKVGINLLKEILER